jgi:toxin FitB
VITPTVAVYEVYKWIRRQRSEREALIATSAMQKTHIVDLTIQIAIKAAELSVAHKLAMADSIILATARAFDAELLTTDRDYDGLDGVTVFSKRA